LPPSYCYHSMMEDNFIFLALAGKAVSKYVVYKFLEEIKNKFIKQISPEKRNTANAFSLTTSFSDVLKSEMVFFKNFLQVIFPAQERTNSLGDKLLTFKSNLVETKEIVETNIGSNPLFFYLLTLRKTSRKRAANRHSSRKIQESL